MDRHLEELAELVGGTLVGDGSVRISAASTLVDSGPGHITLVDDPQKVDLLGNCEASAVVVPRGVSVALPRIEVDDVHAAFTQIARQFRPVRKSGPRTVSPQAFISPQARLGQNVAVHPGAFVGDDVELGDGTTVHAGVQIMAGCRIGRDVTLFPGVVLYEDTRLGDRVTVHSGAVLGAYGFGYRMVDGRHVLCSQLGYVEIGDDVDIGAGTTIDRGTYGPTRVGSGTKIDNQVQIGHNCRIGSHNLICSQVGIAGSTSTGDYVVIAGQVGIRDHVHIGDQAVLGAMAGISNDVPAHATMLGIPATPEREQKLKQAALSKLPEMRRQWKKLTAEVARLRGQIEQLTADSQAGASPQEDDNSAAAA